jgi:hypothetical protein
VEPSAGATVPSVSLTHRSARRWLIAVGIAYAAIQLAAFDLHRAPSWDEAIYLSQVTPGADAYHFVASRARGITILVAPLAAIGSLPTIRAGVAILAAIGLVAAFLPWIPTIGSGAPAGAAFLASTWTVSFYGSEVMPNLWVGLAGVAALGLVVRRGPVERVGREDIVAAAILFLAALFRPFDAVLLGGAVASAAILVGRRPLRTAGLLVAGIGVGCLPWLAEMAVRYGGVGTALDQAITVAHVSVPGPWARLIEYVAMADGPTIGPVVDPGLPIPGIVMATVVATAVTTGVVAARRSGAAGSLLACLGAAGLFSAAYVGAVGGVAPRFLLPATALVAVPAGCGLVALWRDARHPAARAVLLVAFVAWPLWHGWLAVRLESSAARERAGVRDVGRLIGTRADGVPCVVASVVGAPQVGLAAGCRGRSIVDTATVDEVLAEESRRGVPRVFLVLDAPLARTPAGTSGRWEVAQPGTRALWIYRVDR